MKIILKKIYRHIDKYIDIYKNISNKSYKNNEKLKSCFFLKGYQKNWNTSKIINSEKCKLLICM